MFNWQDAIKELLMDESDRMSAWEVEFVESMSNKPRDFIPSERQLATIEKVWSKVFA